MKKLFVFLLGLLTGNAQAAEGPQLGSDSDRIRQMLFASQSLQEMASRIQTDGQPGVLRTLVDAAKLVKEGKRREAITGLRSILETPKVETRVVLWTWTALRELGEAPDAQHEYEVLGVVLEVPSGGGYDTLSAYVDGTARYLNYSGKAIFWDAPDAKIHGLCQALVDSTIPPSQRAEPRSSLALPKKGTQATLLTRAGIYVITDPPDSVLNAGLALMMEMTQR